MTQTPIVCSWIQILDPSISHIQSFQVLNQFLQSKKKKKEIKWLKTTLGIKNILFLSPHNNMLWALIRSTSKSIQGICFH